MCAPTATVVIPALNADRTIGAALDALIRQDPGFEFEVVVSDNGSGDATRRVAEAKSSSRVPVRVVDSSAQRGVAPARNVGAEAARGEHLLFCDADDIVSKDWIANMVGALEIADLVGGALEQASLNPGIVGWRGESPLDRLPGTLFLPSGTGGNMAVRRSVYDDLNGFDTRFNGVAGEDLDFWWRAQYADCSIGFVTDALVHVRYRHSLKSLGTEAFRHGAAVPLLYRVHRRHGMPRRPFRLTCRQLGWVFVRLPRIIAGREQRGSWVWGACNLLGRIQGAIRNRVASI